MPAFQSTLTKFSSPYKPATGFRAGAPIWQLTASGSGSGSASSVSLSRKAKTATGSGTSSQTAQRLRVVPRSATGSGVGNYTIVISGPIQFRLGAISDFSFPFLNGGRFYLGPAYYLRTATSAGSSTESSTFIRGLLRSATGSGSAGESTSTDLEIIYRTATGSGSSSQDADPFLFVIRQATGSGAGSSSTTFKRIHLRVATGSGTGTSSVSRIVKNIRTATGSGSGSAVAVRHVVTIRTATASGVGTASSISIELLPRTATGSGAGATVGFATWSKSRIFRVPQTTTYAFATLLGCHQTGWQPSKQSVCSVATLFGDNRADRLFAHVPPGVRAENLYRLSDGTYTINDPRDGSATREYLGGHNIFLTDEEVAELTAAGYGAYIT